MNNKLHLLSDVDLLNKYQQDPSNSQITEILISKYEYIIKKLAASHTKNHANTSYEDNLQNARVGAILAFNRFNQQTNCQPATFVYSTIFYYLLSCNDEQSFVNCPSNLREVKSYIGGKYDYNPIKKTKFEAKHKINSQQDIDELIDSHSLLNTEAIQVMPDELIPDIVAEDNVLDYVDNNIFLESLSEENRSIVGLLMDGYSQTKIAEILSTQNNKISAKQVNTRMNLIKKKIVQYYYD